MKHTLLAGLSIITWAGAFLLFLQAHHGGTPRIPTPWLFASAITAAATSAVTAFIRGKHVAEGVIAASYDLGFEQGVRTGRRDNPDEPDSGKDNDS